MIKTFCFVLFLFLFNSISSNIAEASHHSNAFLKMKSTKAQALNLLQTIQASGDRTDTLNSAIAYIDRMVKLAESSKASYGSFRVNKSKVCSVSIRRYDQRIDTSSEAIESVERNISYANGTYYLTVKKKDNLTVTIKQLEKEVGDSQNEYQHFLIGVDSVFSVIRRDREHVQDMNSSITLMSASITVNPKTNLKDYISQYQRAYKKIGNNLTFVNNYLNETYGKPIFKAFDDLRLVNTTPFTEATLMKYESRINAFDAILKLGLGPKIQELNATLLKEIKNDNDIISNKRSTLISVEKGELPNYAKLLKSYIRLHNQLIEQRVTLLKLQKAVLNDCNLMLRNFERLMNDLSDNIEIYTAVKQYLLENFERVVKPGDASDLDLFKSGAKGFNTTNTTTTEDKGNGTTTTTTVTTTYVITTNETDSGNATVVSNNTVVVNGTTGSNTTTNATTNTKTNATTNATTAQNKTAPIDKKVIKDTTPSTPGAPIVDTKALGKLSVQA